MKPTPERLELKIDIPGRGPQRAQALAALTPADLVEAALQEFRGELEFLSDRPEDYRLVRANGRAPLDEAAPLGAQLHNGDELAFEERARPVPAGARPLSRPVYLREQSTGTVFRLAWQPALIGRPDRDLADNELLAVNLAPLLSGTRVSRRHAQIVEEGGQLFVESLAQNPTAIRDATDAETPVAGAPVPVQAGDVIYLERSKLALKVIVRE